MSIQSSLDLFNQRIAEANRWLTEHSFTLKHAALVRYIIIRIGQLVPNPDRLNLEVVFPGCDIPGLPGRNHSNPFFVESSPNGYLRVWNRGLADSDVQPAVTEALKQILEELYHVCTELRSLQNRGRLFPAATEMQQTALVGITRSVTLVDTPVISRRASHRLLSFSVGITKQIVMSWSEVLLYLTSPSGEVLPTEDLLAQTRSIQEGEAGVAYLRDGSSSPFAELAAALLSLEEHQLLLDAVASAPASPLKDTLLKKIAPSVEAVSAG